MAVFMTFDADGVKVPEGATLHRFKDFDEALGAAERHFAGADVVVTDLVAGSYGDAWLKLLEEPDDDTLRRLCGDTGLTPSDLRVAAPGSHPGGRAWWVYGPDCLVPEIE